MFEKLKRSIQPVINIYHMMRAIVASQVYNHPAKHIKIIGVTGTDGKTTTSHLIYHILKYSGKRTSLISTVYAKIGKKVYETGLHTTTPDAFFVQKLIRRAVDAGDEYLVLETTSHALDQNRVYGVRFTIGVVTNITPEHLDYHKTYERYAAAKAKLLLNSDVSIINIDDRSFNFLHKKLEGRNFLTYGLQKHADYTTDFSSRVRGLSSYNRYNYLAAYATAIKLGLSEKEIVESFGSFRLPPGRLETVYNKDYQVIVDFAHTTNSLEQVLKHLRGQVVPQGGRLIHVFGAAGLRDASKRAAMGEASGKYADISIITEEDYRTEDPIQISKEIALGLVKQGMRFVKNLNKEKKKDRKYTIVVDRQEAISLAVAIARAGDVIVTTGKSHEKSLCRGKIEYPWDERGAIEKAVKRRK